jgi:hypothetical protein
MAVERVSRRSPASRSQDASSRARFDEKKAARREANQAHEEERARAREAEKGRQIDTHA